MHKTILNEEDELKVHSEGCWEAKDTLVKVIHVMIKTSGAHFSIGGSMRTTQHLISTQRTLKLTDLLTNYIFIALMSKQTCRFHMQKFPEGLGKPSNTLFICLH